MNDRTSRTVEPGEDWGFVLILLLCGGGRGGRGEERRGGEGRGEVEGMVVIG